MQIDCLIDIPFEFRHTCYFCGEPSNRFFSFPHSAHIVLACSHPKLTLPCCNECRYIAYTVKQDDVWQVVEKVKQTLIKKYQKDLAIGVNWTREELANSGFEGGNFESFQKSAWFMFEVARDRVNFPAWPISLNGIELERLWQKSTFVFDGISFPSIDDAVGYYCKAFDLNKQWLRNVLAKLGVEKFAVAVRFCRNMKGATPNEMQVALAQLRL
ncbi:hypothetical protein HII17_18035 [Thalassotalea sp. M1531]|uniref:Uncharacterized protein n=1 Tax=Thalassotalea algicola TaxID=2716224 RepID=A0A7Y0LF97_9GAMM|nr:hypothetical protein [Thalassotalea algicola]NMP33450.1 hypothetical protein [Thalassotalea algicola]